MSEELAIHSRDVVQYMLCPRRWMLANVDKLEPRFSSSDAYAAALKTAVRGCLERKSQSADEVMAKFEADLSGEILRCNSFHGPDLGPMIAQGRRFIAQFDLLERPAIFPLSFDTDFQRRVVAPNWTGMRQVPVDLTADANVVEKTAIGYFRLNSRNLSGREMAYDLQAALGTMAAHCPNVWIVLFNTRTGTIQRFAFSVRGVQLRTALDALLVAAEGIRDKAFGACDFTAPWCSRASCGWYDQCRGKIPKVYADACRREEEQEEPPCDP